MKTFYYLSILVLLLSILISCGKEEEINIIPYSLVHFEVDLRKTPDRNLVSPGHSEIFTQPRLATDRMGYSGLLITCSPISITGNIFQLYAYDLCCSYEKQQNVRVQPSENGTAKCAKCGSVYNILNGMGNPISGPAQDNLQGYLANYQNSVQPIFIITRRKN